MMREGKYIYCIIEGRGKSEEFGPIGIGGRGDLLHTVCFNDLAAVVSNTPIKRFPVSREYLIPHEKAIEVVMDSHNVLPVRFATIAENEDMVKKILEKEHDRLVNLLKYMEDKKELGLKAVFHEKEIYNEILANYEEIRILKEKMAKQPVRKFDLIEIGRDVEDALENEKKRYRVEILDSLTPLALEVKVNLPYGERMILNAAFLVEKHNEPAFDLKVNEFADRYGNKMKLKYIGKVPPFNFVNIDIDTGDY